MLKRADHQIRRAAVSIGRTVDDFGTDHNATPRETYEGSKALVRAYEALACQDADSQLNSATGLMMRHWKYNLSSRKAFLRGMKEAMLAGDGALLPAHIATTRTGRHSTNLSYDAASLMGEVLGELRTRFEKADLQWKQLKKIPSARPATLKKAEQEREAALERLKSVGEGARVLLSHPKVPQNIEDLFLDSDPVKLAFDEAARVLRLLSQEA